MSVVGYRARNHPQQVAIRGARSSVDDRAITAEDFAPLHARFRFTVDAAASAENARLPRYWTREDNALTHDWADERVWANPPYSHPNLARWLDKAWQEAARAELIVMLVPANRTEQAWWQRHIEPHRDRSDRFRTEFLPGRLRFLGPGQGRIGPNERPPFGCCLLIWRGPDRAHLCVACGREFQQWQRRTETDAGAGPLHAACNPEQLARDRAALHYPMR